MALEAGLGKVAADPELLQDYRHQIPSLLRAQSFPTHKAVGDASFYSTTKSITSSINARGVWLGPEPPWINPAAAQGSEQDSGANSVTASWHEGCQPQK